MRVYRYLSDQELFAFFDGDIENIGAEYCQNKYAEVNTHKYEDGKRYVHFMKHIQDLDPIRDFKRNVAGIFYICSFNIPELLLLAHRGRGYYNGHGYDIDHYTIKEYAVPAEKVEIKQLEAFVLDRDRNLPADKAAEILATKRVQMYNYEECEFLER